MANRQYVVPIEIVPGSGGGGGTPGGTSGDIQYNNAGTFGGSAATADSAGNIVIPGNLWVKSVSQLGNASVSPTTPPVAGDTAGWVTINNTDTRISNFYAGLVQLFTVIPSGDDSGATDYVTDNITLNVDPTSTHAINLLTAAALGANNYGSGAVSEQIGIDVGCFNLGSGTVTTMEGAEFDSLNVGSGNVTQNFGVLAFSGNASSTGGVITNDISVQINSPAHAGQMANHYGLYISDQTLGGANNPNPFAIYVAGGKTYLAGSLTINSTLIDGTSSVGSSGQVLSSTVTGVKWISNPSAAWATLTGDLTETQVIPFDGPTPGTADTGISRTAAKTIAIGNGTTGDFSGTLEATTITMPLLASVPSIVATGHTTNGFGWRSTGDSSPTIYGNNVYVYNSSGSVTSVFATEGSFWGPIGEATSLGFLMSANLSTDTYPTVSAVALGNQSNLTGTSGTQVGVAIGGPAASAAFLNWRPTSGAASFIAALIQPTINQQSTATGNPTCLGIYPVNTAVLGTAPLLIGAGSAASIGGAVTNVFTVPNSGKIGTYSGIATVSNGVPSELAVSDLTAQSAAISATTLYATTATGMYRVSWSATITTADGVSSVLGGTNGFQVLYTSPTDSVVKTTVSGNSVTSSANTTGTAVGGVEVIYAKTSTNIQYQYGYTSATPGQMVYELHLKVEAL